ncbi:MAG: hypothetical protein JOZ02_20610 [Acidobacteria bacterium]|nr:hypothetical protein [Acidobacteriota bacterium]
MSDKKPGRRQETERGGDPLPCGPGRASEPDSPNPAQRTESPNPLQLKEMDEINNWARSGGQVYFGWFTLMLTVNGLGVGWLFTHNGPLPPFAPLLFGVFIVLDLMATASTYYIRNHMLACDTRITAILEGLARRRAAADPPLDVQSPVPREAVRTVFLFTGGTMFLLLLFWTTLTGWGLATNFSRLVAG